MTSPERTNIARGKELDRTYLGWQKLEDSIESGVDVYDFNFALVSDKDRVRILSRMHARDRLTVLTHEYNTSTHDGEYLRAKTLASIAFIDALGIQDRRRHRLSVSKQSIAKYIEATMPSVKLEPCPRRVLITQRNLVDGILNTITGKKWDEDGWNDFKSKYRIAVETVEGREKVASQFEGSSRRYSSVVMDTLNINDYPSYTTNFVQEDKPWIFWVDGDRVRGIEVKVNTHPLRTQIRWVEGVPEVLGTHEIGGHVTQMDNWKRRIDKGEMNPAYGLTNIPGPESWMMEGVANTVPLLFPDIYTKMTDFGKLELERQILAEMVRNNVHLRVTRGELPRRPELTEYIRFFLPGETNFRINRLVHECRYHPVESSYRAAYENGTIWFAERLRGLPDENLTDFATCLYSRPSTPVQVKDRFSKIIGSNGISGQEKAA